MRLADFITTDDSAASADTAGGVIDSDEVSQVVLCEYSIGGLGEDGGANVSDVHLFDPLLGCWSIVFVIVVVIVMVIVIVIVIVVPAVFVIAIVVVVIMAFVTVFVVVIDIPTGIFS